jgi:hypothetical protein
MSNIILDYFAWIIPSVIVFFILINYWKNLYLRIVMTFYGRYSLRYVDTFKRLFFSNPYPPGIKDEFINHVIPFFQKNKQIKTYSTSQRIDYMNFPFASNVKALIRLKRNPGFLTISDARNQRICNNGHVVKIFGYNEDIFDAQVRVLYYFINEKFFMGELYLSKTTEKQAKLMSGMIAEKYKLNDFSESNDFLIKGPDGTSINYKNTGFSIMIRYFNINDAEVARSIKDCVASFISSKDTTQDVGDKNWTEGDKNWTEYV